MTSDILFSEVSGWGVVTLNREKALNALTREMVVAMHDQLDKWASDPSIAAVMVKGAGEKAFCAGGDIRWLHDAAKQDPRDAAEFFRDEYTNNAKIFHFPKPYVALIDGVIMGGGVGISVHGDFRIAGDKTLFAMPETGIGLFPDVGGGYFMPRLDGGLGLYLALTGARAKGADCLYAGIATHYMPSEKLENLEAALLAADFAGGARDAIRHILDAYGEDPQDAPSLAAMRADIDRLFNGHTTLRSLMDALEKDGGEFAASTVEVLARMSPTSLALTFEQMRRGADLSFDEVMKMEFRMVCRVMKGHDFFEGVRAQILDKDRQPKWKPASLADVSTQDIGDYFKTLDNDELVLA